MHSSDQLHLVIFLFLSFSLSFHRHIDCPSRKQIMQVVHMFLRQ